MFFLFNSPQAFSSKRKDSSLENCRKAVSNFNIFLTDTVGRLDISFRLRNKLRTAGIVYIGELDGKKEEELLKAGFDTKLLDEIKGLLSERGMRFALVEPTIRLKLTTHFYKRDKGSFWRFGYKTKEFKFKKLLNRFLKVFFIPKGNFTLTPIERKVLNLYFGLGWETSHTIEEVRQILNIGSTNKTWRIPAEPCEPRLPRLPTEPLLPRLPTLPRLPAEPCEPPLP